MIAEVERLMDSGEIPYVLINGHRTVFSKEVMEEFKVVNGQSISLILAAAMTEASIASLKISVELDKIKKNKEKSNG